MSQSKTFRPLALALPLLAHCGDSSPADATTRETTGDIDTTTTHEPTTTDHTTTSDPATNTSTSTSTADTDSTSSTSTTTGTPDDPVHVWSRSSQGNGHDFGVRVAFAANGDLIVTGRFDGKIEFGGAELVSVGGWDFFLARYSPTGDHLWSRSWGGYDDQGHGFNIGLAVAANGDILIGGDSDGPFDLGGGLLANDGPFLARLTGDGDHVWSASFFGPDAQLDDLELVGDDVLIAGLFYNELIFDDEILESADAADAFVARFTGDGAHKWARRFGGMNLQSAERIVADAAGNAYVVGSMRGTLELETGTLVSAGVSDVLLFALDPDGATLWGQRFGSPEIQSGYGIAIDAQARITIAGYTHSPLDFGGGPIGENDHVVGFLAQFSSDGAHVWSRPLCRGDDWANLGLATDALGNILFAHHLLEPCDLGGGPLLTAGASDHLIAKFSPDGVHQWSRNHGDSDDQFAEDATISSTGRIATTGGFRGTLDFGGGPLSNSDGDNYEMFVAVFDP